MATNVVIELVRRYLTLLREEGFHVQRAVVFGSQARDEAHADSDIDLLIPSPDFDALTWKQEERLWSLTARLDSHIEPILCGETYWWNDQVSPLIEAVRLEGVVIYLDPQILPHSAREVDRAEAE